MKKISMLLLIFVLMLTLTGCGKDVISTKNCTMQNDSYVEIYKITATNDEIDKVELTIVYDNSMFNVESLDILDDTQKDQIKTNMLDTLGLESTTYEGFEINIEVEEQMSVNIKADLKLADTEVLKKVGLDFSNTDMSFERAVKDLEETGAVCE